MSWDDFTDWVEDTVGTVTETAGDAVSTAEDFGETVVDAIEQGSKDAAKAMRDLLYGNENKGIDYFVFLSKSPPFTVTVSATKLTLTDTQSGTEIADRTDIAVKDLDLDELTGRFSLEAKKNGQQIAYRYVEINPLTGNLGGDPGSDSNMCNMLRVKSILGPDYAVCYGFFDAMKAVDDKAWMYVSGNQSRWMGDLMQANPQFASQTFSAFALPGAHDAGMCKVNEFIHEILGKATGRGLFKQCFGIDLPADMPDAYVIRLMTDLGVTQKDTPEILLNLGIRYFDFRPGFCFEMPHDVLFHQHLFIPGIDYQTFLTDVRDFLLNNPTEIVVVALSCSGFMSDSMKPDGDTLNYEFDKAFNGYGDSIQKGTKADIHLSYNDLIASKKRIIFLNNDNVPIDSVKRYDKYDKKYYETLDPSRVIECLDSMVPSGQAGNDVTIFQLQATANGVFTEIARCIVSMSDTASPLMHAKPRFDISGYNWINSRVSQEYDPRQLVAFLNDFADNQMVFHSINISKRRFEALNSVLVFQDWKFGGDSRFIQMATPQLGSDWTSRISSMKIPEGFQVLAFDSANFTGNSKIFIGDNPELGDWNDKIASIQIMKAGEVIFYKGTQYSGDFEVVSSDADFLYDWNDCINSMKIAPGYRVEAFAEGSYKGDSAVFIGEVSDLGDLWKNKISSITIAKLPIVTLFKEARFAGDSCTRSSDVMEFETGWSDCINSMSIPEGYCVEVFKDVGFKGDSITLTGDVDDVGDTWRNQISSMKIVKRMSVVCYKQAHFGGGFTVLGSDVAQLQFDWNDGINSLRVSEGCYAQVFKDGNYGGDSTIFIGDVEDVGDAWRNQISSIKIAKVTGAILYKAAQYGGDFKMFDTDALLLDYDWNDCTNSVRVSAGYSLEVFKDVQFGGDSTVLRGNIGDLGDFWRNQITSFKIHVD